MRLVTYTIAYRFIIVVIIGKTKKLQLIYTGYILLALLVFFFLEKITVLELDDRQRDRIRAENVAQEEN